MQPSYSRNCFHKRKTIFETLSFFRIVRDHGSRVTGDLPGVIEEYSVSGPMNVWQTITNWHQVFYFIADTPSPICANRNRRGKASILRLYLFTPTCTANQGIASLLWKQPTPPLRPPLPHPPLENFELISGRWQMRLWIKERRQDLRS